MYAIVKNGGKQYKVQEGDLLFLDNMDLEIGVELDLQVLAVMNGENMVLNNGSVKAEVISEGRAKKVIIYKKLSRKDSKLKRGFRRDYTKVKITKISA